MVYGDFLNEDFQNRLKVQTVFNLGYGSFNQTLKTMALDFEKYAMKGNEFLNSLAKRLGNEDDRDRAARILRSVFHVLRNHLTVEESMHLIAQLPMALKGVYVEGWNIHKTGEKVKTLEELANEVIREEGNVAWRDFSNLDEVIAAVKAVAETMTEYVSGGQLQDMTGTLPKGLRRVFSEWITA